MEKPTETLAALIAAHHLALHTGIGLIESLVALARYNTKGRRN